jgi:hypothetical protein
MTRAILATALVAAASWAAADEVWLKGGGRIVGEVVERTPDTVRVDVGPGTVAFPMARVDRIVASSSRLAEYRSRAARLNPADVQGWLALAAWADQNDLRTQARAAWQQVLTLQPNNAAAHRALGNVLQAGVWMDHADAMRARGLVEHEGAWISPAERENRLRLAAAESAALRENAIADARVAEAEARAREAEARAHAAEIDAERAADYGDGGIPLDYVYGGIDCAYSSCYGPFPPPGYGPGHRPGHGPGHGPGRPRVDPAPRPTPKPPHAVPPARTSSARVGRDRD